MSPVRFPVVLTLSALFGMCATSQPARASWPNDPTVNVPVCRVTGDQFPPTLVSDGSGGAILTWQDHRSGTNDIYAQHVLVTGTVDPAWPLNGQVVCNAAHDQVSPTLVEDGVGGAIITWADNRGGSYYHIDAQHILSSGVVDPAWPVNGRALCTASGDQASPTIVADGSGGAIVTWADQRADGNDIYAQHVLSTGAVDPAWPVNGRALCTAAWAQYLEKIVSDGAGGAIVAWTDERNWSSSSFDILAQHVLASGAVDPAWPLDGMAVCSAAGEQSWSTLVSDGAGGAVVTWKDQRSGSDFHIYAQRVRASGTVDPLWPVDGVALCTAAGNKEYPTIDSDGSSGAIVTWHDHRSGTDYDIYAQHVSSSGSVDPAWPTGGALLCNASGDQDSPNIVRDGAGGAIVTWYDLRGANMDIYAQHVLASGVLDPFWPASGRAICAATKDQTWPAICSDGSGGAIIGWRDDRDSTWDIYVQGVAGSGGDAIAAVPDSGLCISTAHPCVAVPVNITRLDPTPVRGYSVTFTLSPNLALCGSQIVEQAYLSSVSDTHFAYHLNPDGTYTVDCAIMGLPCGATGNGTLFMLNLGSSSPSGTGTVTINSVVVRDCNNDPVPAGPGAVASIEIDNTTGAAIANLAAAQQLTGNPAGFTTQVSLTWSGVAAGDQVKVYRAGYGHHPEYDDAGGSVPGAPGVYPPGAPWEPAGTVDGGGGSYVDHPLTRDYWYYAAYVVDPCGNVSAVSNQTNGTLNYHLGDVSDGTTPGLGNDAVATEDISLLGLHYWLTLVPDDPYNYLDVGPTNNHHVDGRPLTDNKVDFEDLMMFAVNYHQVSKAVVTVAAAARDEVGLEVSGGSGVGEVVTARLVCAGTGRVKGLSVALAWNPAVVEPVSVGPGELLDQLGGMALPTASGGVDIVVLGEGHGILGKGALARVGFRRIGTGDPGIALGSLEARDAHNDHVELGVGSVPPARPTVTALRAPAPNPFRGSTTLEFSLAQPGQVILAIYAVDGRQVRMLISDNRTAAVHRISWDGRDDGGRPVASGLYLCRLAAGGRAFVRRIVAMR